MMEQIIKEIKENKMSIIGVLFALMVLLCIIIPIYTYTQGVEKNISQSLINARLQADTEYQKISASIEEINNEFEEQKAIYDDYTAYKNAKAAKDAEIIQLDATIQEKNNSISSLDADISAKSAELDKLKNAIQRTEEEPKVLTAGHYTVGNDLPPGRYIVTGSSNFIVYSLWGDLKVNTILGGQIGVESFTCELESGDTMQLSGKDTFTPIK